MCVMNRVMLVVASCAVMMGVCGRVMAQPHDGDVLVVVENGRIGTAIENADGTHSERRVFESVLGEVFPDFSNEPGFDSEPGTFTPGSRVGFRILDALRKWDGVGFAEVPQERMEVALSTLSVMTPEAPGVVEGFSLLVGSTGQWHRHLEYTLQAPARDGVYLLQLQLVSDAGVGDSLPFFIVFDQNVGEAVVDPAVAWVEGNLLGPVCATADFNGDGDFGTDADIESFFACLAGSCCAQCWRLGADFNGDGDIGTDGDEAFFRVLAGNAC